VHDYLFSVEIVRFAFVAGVAVSMMLYERRHLTTGSIVVPGYVAVFLVFPTVLVATLANAFVSYLIVNKLLPRWVLVYGRSKFTLLALISISIQTAMLKLSPSGSWMWERDVPLFVGVGYVIPALVAHDMGRQGIMKTIKSIGLAAVIVAVPIIVALLADLPGVNDLSPLDGFGDTHIAARWVPVAVLLSASAAWGIATNYGMRSGGFVGAAFVAVFTADPWQVALAIGGALATYVLVTRVLMRHLILFGRRKFASMLLVSSLMVWVMLWFGAEVLSLSVSNHMRVSSLALTPLFLPGLLANDMERTSPGKVLLGVTIAASFVLSMTWWLQSIVEGASLSAPIWLAALTLGSFIFWPQLSSRPTRWIGAKLAGTRRARRARPLQTFGEFYAQSLIAPAARDAPPAPIVAARLPWSANGYEHWRRAHRDAAVDAEQWLAGQLTQGQPAVAVPASAHQVASTTRQARVLQRLERFEQLWTSPAPDLSTVP
jgi:poly-gamma-glutamate biosynthesis protein PgsC/CapC